MGFQGQLSSVNLTDIFQTLSMNRQSGTLVVTAAAGKSHVYFNNGLISSCTSVPVSDRPFLLHVLINRNLLTEEKADTILASAQSTGQNLRDAVIADGAVPDAELPKFPRGHTPEAFPIGRNPARHRQLQSAGTRLPAQWSP